MLLARAARSLRSAVTLRFASSVSADGTHPDFQPRRKVNAEDEAKETQKFIANAVKEDPVVLFMKGTPDQPMCGFSRGIVQVLRAEGARFAAYNVLESDALRNGIKQFSNWPTIPQLFIEGEFIGGTDVTTEMHQKGELAPLLQKAGAIKK